MKGLGLRTHEVGFAESVQQTARRINRSGIVIKVRASDFTQPLGRMSAKANEFTKSLEASNARVIAFGASAAIIGGVTTSFAQLVIQATKVEKILTDINVVLGTTSQNLAKFGDGLFKVARNTSQSLETAAEAALEFSRQGLSMEETLKRTNDALILTRLTSLKAADSVKGLTAAVNGFADAGLTTTNIINKLAAVDVKFAVSTDDLINALARAGAVAQDAGVSFDQLMGAVTAAQQITARGGAVIGNSFKTIFTRVQRSSTIKRLEELGIAVRNVKGETLPAMTVLQNLASTYEGLQGATKAAVAEQVGGVFQINILKAAIKDLNKESSIYARATEASASATNQAQMKNAQLQKTLSSIANQTLTTVRELTSNLGELTIAPALKDFLESANKLLGGLSDLFGDKEGETIGGEFAKGFARALGSVLTGPGVMITVLVFAKLFAQAFKFAKDSIKDLLQIASIKDKERMIQESIVDAMIKNVDLSKQLIAYDKDQVKQEQVVLALLKEQTAHLEQQRAIAKAITPGLRKQGVQPNLVVDSSSKNQSQGFVPNYNNQPTPLEKSKERQGAAKGGYTAGAISTMNVSGLGRVVYNKNETVKKFDGMTQQAIMPPEKSKAGRNYKDKFSGAHGFDPYQGSKNNSTYSMGFVPNFARQVGSTLEMDPAKLLFVGGGGSNKQEKAQIEAALKDPKQLMHFTAALDQVAGYDKNGKLKTGARVMNPLSVLQHELGINHIKRGFSMRKKPRLRGKQKDPADAMEEKVAGVERQNQKHAALSPKLRATRTGYRDKKTGKKKGIQNYPVDVVSYGASWPTIEVKSGEFHPHNIISKSLRMASDRELGDFIRKNTSRPDIADALDQANFNSAASAAKSLDLFDPVSSKKVGGRDFDISDTKDREFIDMWGLSKGLVPNFISQNARDAIMRLRKQGSTKGERKAADAALGRTGKKTFNIKKKDGTRASMYEGMYIDSYIKGSGGQSDLDYLLGKGFDKSILTSAKKAFKNDPSTIINSSRGFVPNFIDDFVVQALPPHSGFYNKGNFVQNKSQADRMSRSKAVQVSNILLQNRKVKSKIFQMKGDSLMGDSGIFDRQKPGRHLGLIPNFMEEVDRKRREKEIRDSHQDGSMNRKYFGGLIPNFAFQNTAIRLDGGFGRRGRQIRDTDTDSYMNYTKSGHNVRDIDFLQSNKKGDAYKMFNHASKSKFVKSGGTYTSGSLKQQRSFKQNSSSNFEDLLYAFPQVRYRMQEGITTSGRLINEGLGSQHKFNNTKDLKSYVNRVGRKDFQGALGAQEIGNRILITDLSTGRDGSKNRKYFGGLIPNFADTLEHKQREKDIRDSHQDGSKNRKYSQGLVPNFNVGYAISDQSASKWYNAGNFGARSQAKIFPTLNAAQNTANIVQSNRKMKVRIFYISDGGGIREVVGAFSDTVYRPGRSDGMVPDMQGQKGKGRDGQIKEKHQDGSDNQKYFKGLIPNFLAEQLEHKQREKDIMESHQDGSMNRKYFRGLIPNFANDIENKQREKEIFESHQDGSKNRKYSSGLVPNFIRSGTTSREFAKLSVSLAKWSARNHPEPRLKLIGPDKLFSIPRRNADEANKNIQNIRQFISSAEYRALEAPQLKKKITRFYNRAMARSSLDNPDRSFAKGDHTFEGRIAASNGLIPNFLDPFATNQSEDLARILAGTSDGDMNYPHLQKNMDGTLSGNYAYAVSGGRLFKPSPGQRLEGLTDGQFINGKIMMGNKPPKKGKIKLSTLKNSQPASTGQSIAFNTLPGHIYEQALADEYITSGWTGKGPSRIDFKDAAWDGKTPIGRGPNNFTRKWGQADAIKGLSHGPRLIMQKLWGQYSHQAPFHKAVMEASKRGVLDLTTFPLTDDFAEISGSAPSDKKAKSSNVFHPTQSKTFPGLKPGSGNSLKGKGAERLKPFKIHWNLDAFHMNNGLIPNFADPLGEAVAREKSALKSQGSSAQVYVDQDNRLKGPKNPMGLLVANRRDEPVSGSQGVNRALNRGLDPKHHGASNGFFPNYATKRDIRAQNDPAFAANVGEINKPSKMKTDGVDKLNESSKKASNSVDKHGDSSEKGTMMGMDLMGAMFALTSVTYAVEGAMGEVESTAGKTMKAFNAVVMGGSQAAMVFQGMNSVADGFAKKNTKTGNILSKVAKGAGIFGAAIGAAIPIFDALKNFETFQTPFEKLQKTIKETSEAFENAKAAVDGLAQVEQEREALGKLEASTKPKTLKTELEMFNRRTQLIQTENEYNKTLADLKVSVGLTDEQMRKLSSSSADAQVELAKIMREKAVKEGTMATVASLTEPMSNASMNLLGAHNFSGFGTDVLNLFRKNEKQTSIDEDTEKYFARRKSTSIELGLQGKTLSSGLKEADLNKLINIFNEGMHLQTSDKERYQTDETSSFAKRGFTLAEEGGQNLAEDLRKMILGTKSVDKHGGGSTVDFDDSTITSSMAGFVDSLGNIADPLALNMAMQELVKGFKEARDHIRSNADELDKVDQDFLNRLKTLREEMLNNLKLSSQKASMALARMGDEISIDNDTLNFENELNAATGLITREMQHRAETEAMVSNANKEFALSVKKKQNELDSKANDILVDMGIKNDMLDSKFTSTSGGTLDKPTNPMEDNSQEFMDKVVSLSMDLEQRGASFRDHKTGDSMTGAAAFERFQDKINYGGSDGMGAENPAEIKDAFFEYISAIQGGTVKAKALELAHEKGLIPAEVSTQALLALAKEEQASLNDLKEGKRLTEKANSLKSQQNAQNIGTLDHVQQMYEKTRQAAQNEEGVLATQKERRRIEVITSATTLERNRAVSKTLENEYVLSDIQKNANISAENKLITDYEAEVVKGAQLRAEALILEHLELSEKLLSQRVQNEAQQLRNSVTQNQKLLEREKEGGIFDVRSQTTNENSSIDQDRAAEQFASDLRSGSFQLQALHSMADASRNFTKEMIIAQTKLANGEFGREGVREIEMNRINMAGGVQKAKAQRDVYAAAGNAPRAAEVNTQVQTQMRDLNKELNQGSLFLDTWRVKLAEANERIANFSQTLAETSFDAVRDSFRQMFTDITEGTKSTGDIALNFFGSIAKKIQDKLFDQAADQLTAGIFEAFGLKQYHTGGMVNKYAAGGKTNDVPAMLTAGEYVVRKKIVDKIGLNELNKINQTGSLDDLYNKPNEPDDFELFNSGGMVHPPIIRLKEGGSLKNYLSPKSEAQAYNDGGEVSSAVGALSETIERFAGGLAFLDKGGPPTTYNRKYSGLQSDKDRAYANIGAGAGMMAGTALGKMAFGKDNDEPYGGPKGPTRPQQLNTSSALNIDPTGRQMSAKFRREDSYSKDYGKYLLDKYDYDVQQRNQKQMERAQQIGAIATTATMMAGMAIGKKITDKTPTADDLDAKVKGDSAGFQKITRGDHNLNQYQRQAQYERAVSSPYNPSNVTQSQTFAQSKPVGDFSNNYSYDNLVKTHYNKGGSVNVSYMSQGGIVHGPGGIDKVGPVMLDRGEYVIKASSVNKVEKQYPGFFDRLNSVKMNEGGSVGEAAAATTNNTENVTNEGSSSNVTVNINVSSGGEATAQGGDQAQQDFGYKIKEAVVGVIAEQKRVGGMLRGY